MNRVQIINSLLDKTDKKTYLEIGTRKAATYWAVKASKKTGVDPNSAIFDRSIYVKTSDEFFKINKDKFDVIFIDGLHECEQVKRDIANAEKVINKGGFIIVHDCKPLSKEAQLYPQPKSGGTWNGNVWEAMVDYRLNGKKGSFVIDTDHGVGIISERIPLKKLTTKQAITFDNLVKNKYKWLNLIDVSEFKQIEW